MKVEKEHRSRSATAQEKTPGGVDPQQVVFHGIR
jgi:hypothetical protein